MFELLKMLLQTVKVSVSLDRILEAKKKKDSNIVGAELFLLYQKLNDIIVVGKWIISELDNSIEWLENKHNLDQPDAIFQTRLGKLLNYQQNQIFIFSRILMNMRYKLNIISPDEYARLLPLLEGKGKYIAWLLAKAKTEKAYIDINPLPFLELLDSHDGNEASSFKRPDENEVLNDAFDGSVPNINRFCIEQLPALRAFRTHSNGEEVIAQMEVVAKQLRENIINNFDASDLLLSVGDTRSSIDALR